MSIGFAQMASAVQDDVRQRLLQRLAQQMAERQQAEVERSHRASEAHAGAQLEQTGELRRAQETGTEEYRRGQLQNQVSLQQLRQSIEQNKLDWAQQHAGDLASATAQHQTELAAALKAHQDQEDQLRRELAANKPPPAIRFTHFTEGLDKQGNPTGQTYGLDATTNTWSPTKGEGPLYTKAPPGAAQAADATRRKAEAHYTLDELEKAIDDARDLVGPGRGQFTSLEQMVGSADPRAQGLGALMRGAKMQVDAGIGGARAAASPQLVKQWDNLLANKVTPEGLHAAVKAMRIILGPRPNQGTATPPPARRTYEEARKIFNARSAGR